MTRHLVFGLLGSGRCTRSAAALRLSALAALSITLGGDAFSQGRRVRAVRIVEAPKIDGDLTDEAWSHAEPSGDFRQIDPVEGTPSEESEILALYDDDHLYLGFRFFDSDPTTLISTTHERDGALIVDDRVELVIDTFRDRRNSFFFQINPSGSKGDALITDNGSDFNKPWDGIWEAKASVDERGWYAEFAIPFKTLNFREGQDTWGLNAMRFIGRRREQARWAAPNRDIALFNVAEAGDLYGLVGIQQGIGLDVVPFYASSWSKDRTGGGDSDLTGEPGLDAFYKLSSNLTLSLTYNTDFAETEVDERQINITRFPLFFPERRDFFLQDAGVFTFAGGEPGTIPFFSRRIGLADGSEIPIVAGAKLTGRAGDYNIGVLDVLTDDTSAIEGENSFVTRVSKNLGEQSSIGGIFTHGNPGGTDESWVGGIDANFRSTTFRGDKNLKGNVWALRSKNEGVSDDDAAFGAALRYPNDRWSMGMSLEEIQANFDPQLGFVRRTDIRRYSGGAAFQPRINEDIRQLEFSLDTTVFTNTDDVLESWYTELQPFGIYLDSGDSFRLAFQHERERLFEDFEISDGVVIPVDEYDFDRWSIGLDSSDSRDLSGGVSFSGGDFFDGERSSYSAYVNYRTTPYFTSSLSYSQNEIDLEGGEFTTQLASARARVSFSPNLSWNTFVQWDNDSETIGINSRVRWIPKAGREVFFVFNEFLDENRDSVVPLTQELAFKISYTIRF